MGKSRSFLWLNATQFLGALNDNLFKLLVIFFLVQTLGQDRATVVSLASLLFVAPFLIFSHAAGVLADRLSKRDIIVATKALEVGIMLLGVAGVLWQSAGLLYAVLFLMCTQSALFGPCKYGIIPELVSRESLSRANSLLVGATYLAIILGTFMPSFLLLKLFAGRYGELAWFCVGVAVVGLLASLRITRTPPAGGTARFSPWFLREVYRTLAGVWRDRELNLAVWGSAYFLFVGAFIQQNTLLYAQDYLGLGWVEGGYLFPVAALGIGAGAALAGWLSGRCIEFGVVPIGAAGLALGCVALGLVPPSLPAVLGWILVVGVSAGLFIVPLSAFIQGRSPVAQRGEILAASNVLSFLGVGLSAGLFYVLASVLGLSANRGFVVVGLLTAGLMALAVWALPDFLVRFLVVVLTRLVYRIRVDGADHVPAAGPALLAPNHVTWVDALLLNATQQRRIRYVMLRPIYANRWLNPLYRLMRAIPIAADDSPREMIVAIQAARAALEEGFLLCLFPEGALTLTGNMRPFRPGLERILRGLDVPVIPTCIGGAWGSVFSYAGGRLFARRPRLPYPIEILFGAPMPSSSTAAQVQQAVSLLAGRRYALLKDRRRTLAHRMVRQARRGWRRPALADAFGRHLCAGEALAAAVLLGRRLAPRLGSAEMVGLLLPASVGGALANMALTLQGRVPVNLNFTASLAAVHFAIRQCGLRTILTSRAFEEKKGVFEVPAGVEKLMLEDLLAAAGGGERLRAYLAARLAPAPALMTFRVPGPDTVATVMFSSGSTGEPKGVVLTHHNILSNVEGFLQVHDFGMQDRMCGGLPLFHSFGFTCTLWAPLVRGFLVWFHPNPLDTAGIVDGVRSHRLTLLLATPTFLNGYLRRATPEDFASLRTVIVGAEKLQPRTADAFAERFGLRPLEGYGATELAPVAAVNAPDGRVGDRYQPGTREGSVGQPLPGVTMRVVAADNGQPLPAGEAGLLQVAGPNVMHGYLGQPARTAEVLQDGWYTTGDVARIDADGFVFLVDRVSRFSKIGGEMIPHGAIEERILGKLGVAGQPIVVTAVADERRGEQLMVLYVERLVSREQLLDAIKACDLPNLWKPRKDGLVPVEALPTLGSGKLDLKEVGRLARESAGR